MESFEAFFGVPEFNISVSSKLRPHIKLCFIFFMGYIILYIYIYINKHTHICLYIPSLFITHESIKHMICVLQNSLDERNHVNFYVHL